MEIAAKLITLAYYCLVAWVSVLLVWNLIRTEKWEKEVLFLVVLIPFLLRLFLLK